MADTSAPSPTADEFPNSTNSLECGSKVQPHAHTARAHVLGLCQPTEELGPADVSFLLVSFLLGPVRTLRSHLGSEHCAVPGHVTTVGSGPFLG